MAKLSKSEVYALAVVIGLLFLVVLNSAVILLVVSASGLIAGLWIARSGELRRVAIVALAACAVSLVFGVIGLLR